MIDGVEKLTNIDLDNPSATHPHNAVSQGLQRLMRRTAR